MLTIEIKKKSCVEMFKISCVIVRALCGGQVRAINFVLSVCLSAWNNSAPTERI
jgi:hypothetical protein